MTREEAIGVMRDLWCFWKSERYSEREIREACEMAIEALKAETKKCPVCGNDLYEYCFSCCYEGKKVKENEEKATCENCQNKCTDSCENENAEKYGFCGNFIDDVDMKEGDAE